MSDTFTQTTSVSWFGRIQRSVGGVVIGLIAILAMVYMLFWNEGRAVQTAKSLAEGASVVVSVGVDKVDAGNEGRLVHVTGPVTTDSVPSDGDFGISQPSVRLVRTVEMYQWKETSKSETRTKVGGGEETVTTYSYSREWSDDGIDSGSFKQPAGHNNPPMAIHGRSIQIPEGKLGAYTLDSTVLDRIQGNTALPIRADQAPAIDQAYGGNQRVSVVDGRIYLGFNPTTPVIGDYRISYEYVPIGTISVVAKQTGDRFQSYQTQAGDALLMVATGAEPAEKMFADAVTANTIVTWLLRLVGLVVLFIGFAMLMAPLGVLFDVIPFLGSLMRMGTGLIAFLLAVLVGTTVIAIAWFYYRPLLSIGILAAGLAVSAVILMIGRRRRAAMPVPGSAALATPA